jgi:hypothetical protein
MKVMKQRLKAKRWLQCSIDEEKYTKLQMNGCAKVTRKQSSYVASNGMAGAAAAVQQKVGTNQYAVDMTAASAGRSDPARAAQRQQGVMTSCQRDHVLLALPP